MRHSPENRAAVIGAGGFIGSALSRRLRKAGLEVAAYTRSVPFWTSDRGLDEGLASVRSVFWLASSIRPSTAAELPAAVEADRLALAGLIDKLGTVNGEARLITVSSGGTVYDTSQPPPYGEDSPVRPVNEYGRAMLEIEGAVRTWDHSSVLRVSNAYGPGQPARYGQGVVAHWLAAVISGRPVHLVGDDQVARDYVFIEDVVDALVAASTADHPPQVVNVGSGRPTALAELLAMISSVVAPREILVTREPARAFDSPSTWLDVSLARRQLGWEPRTGLPDGLAATWRWMMAERGLAG
ncbi:MAG TPA: NAD-dependent epimerase/dehydratase family protein [Acidimicrobiales bacterium]|nr:NAD-dependent epimerase/dehydratase family protein [Acidimicrobiales bacterium]